MTECDAIRPHITALLDGELPAQDAQEVERHLAECPDCAAVYASSQALKDTARQSPDPEPVDLWGDIGRAIEDTRDETLLDMMRLMRQEMQSLREEVSALRRELALRPAGTASRGTPISLPDAPRKSVSQYRLV